MEKVHEYKSIAAKMKSLQDDSETFSIVWLEDGCTDERLGARAKNVDILFGSDKDGQD